MKFQSTNKKIKNTPFKEVVLKGLAPDGGLFLPDRWPKLDKSVVRRLEKLSFNQIAEAVAKDFAQDIPNPELKNIINKAFNFPVPLRHLKDNIYILELFHGPTMAFKDFGARFLSRCMGYFLRKSKNQLNIIVATSGDTGSAVASGFFGVPNIRVFILYPSGKVSPLQEKQLTTYGGNVVALEVKGTFDDCQKLAKQVLGDSELNRQIAFSSANSINFGRLLPQTFYYLWAVGQLRLAGEKRKPVIVVPSGNMGNIFAGLMAQQAGLPVKKFIAACNSNDIVPKFLKSGKFLPKKSIQTISNAMDVGNPSNFARMLEMFHNSFKEMGKMVEGFSVSDAKTKETIKRVYKSTGYILDPHTAVGIASAEEYIKRHKDKSPIIVLSTAHPAKFKEVVEPVIGRQLTLPSQLRLAMRKKKQVTKIPADHISLKKVLTKRSLWNT